MSRSMTVPPVKLFVVICSNRLIFAEPLLKIFCSQLGVGLHHSRDMATPLLAKLQNPILPQANYVPHSFGGYSRRVVIVRFALCDLMFGLIKAQNNSRPRLKAFQ